MATVDEGEVSPREQKDPLADRFTLDGGGACIAEARHLAAEFLDLARWEYDVQVSQRAEDLTQLVVSELVTNACKYAPGTVAVDLRVVGRTVEIAVSDGDPVLPVVQGSDADRVGQHGLEIVAAVVQSLEARVEADGKSLIARIALTDEAQDRAATPRPC
ncbi:ATP-binding protein [Streptomyces lichenis]|uniref:ATP-binding protein n=1 Tax=Streptomyces lichenis TaxID=2306967 RepID=A0ABT0I586_9ACTN|nr:ATP-binding protein [Streptomyces lichenis]MCK8676483.1 ATP-binding protein [Streptomyces lichenis]